jgi:ribosomal protein S18 acetylase RimI-like enzyme
MKKISYVLGNERLFDYVKELWEELNKLHRLKSLHFDDFYKTLNFETRKANLLKKSKTGSIRVEIAIDDKTQNKVGYCVSSVDKDKIGEIESIYVMENYRNLNIGEELMNNALKWMDDVETIKKVVTVASGNEQVFGFYEKFGFYTRKIELEQIKKIG